MISKRVRFSSCFLRKRWNSACRSTLASRLSRPFSASVTMIMGASAIRSLPRRGSFAFRGRRRRTWSTPAESGGAARRSESAVAATAKKRLRRGTGGLSGSLRVRRVELGEARVVPADVLVVGVELERLLVLGESTREVAVRLHRDSEIVVRPGIRRVLGDRLLETERGFPPVALFRDVGAEGEL